jgi:hypothetical protein
MAWDKDYILITLRDSTTGELDTVTRTVQVQPIDQAYPTGAVSCSQLSCLSVYKPASDLDENTAYDVYVGGLKVWRLQALNAVAPVG